MFCDKCIARGDRDQPRTPQSASVQRNLDRFDTAARIRDGARASERSLPFATGRRSSKPGLPALFRRSVKSLSCSPSNPRRRTPMKSFVSPSTKDRAGVWIAAACFVHCVVGPALLSIAGLSGLITISSKLEPWFFAGSVTLGAASLVPSYRHRHRRMTCLVMFVIGMAFLWFRNRVRWTLVPFEPVATAVGALLLVGAHILNHRLCRRCECCDSAVVPTNGEADVRSGPASCSQ